MVNTDCSRLDSILNPAETLVSPETLKFIVGIGKTNNTVCKKQLTEASRFCLAAYQHRWAEGRKIGNTLPTLDPEHFEVYLHLLNTGSVVTFSEELHIGTSNAATLMSSLML